MGTGILYPQASRKAIPNFDPVYENPSVLVSLFKHQLYQNHQSSQIPFLHDPENTVIMHKNNIPHYHPSGMISTIELCKFI